MLTPLDYREIYAPGCQTPDCPGAWDEDALVGALFSPDAPPACLAAARDEIWLHWPCLRYLVQP
jgi:hypothetical protein